jgi:hypothetical protein
MSERSFNRAIATFDRGYAIISLAPKGPLRASRLREDVLPRPESAQDRAHLRDLPQICSRRSIRPRLGSLRRSPRAASFSFRAASLCAPSPLQRLSTLLRLGQTADQRRSSNSSARRNCSLRNLSSQTMRPPTEAAYAHGSIHHAVVLLERFLGLLERLLELKDASSRLN